MPNPELLEYGQHYHIYNRGNSGEPLFREDRNYAYFLKLYGTYIEPVAKTYAYCLLSNHFRFLVCIGDRQPSDERRPVPPSRAFANLFGTYAKAFNRAYHRTGSLFEKPFRRRRVDNDHYFAALVTYIHRNPQMHGFVEDFRDWPYSSYRAIQSSRPSRIQRAVVLDWFDGPAGFEEAHISQPDQPLIEPMIADDWM